MSALLLGNRRSFSVSEVSRLTGYRADTLRARIRRRDIAARDLSAGTGKAPRYRVPAREMRRLLREVGRL